VVYDTILPEYPATTTCAGRGRQAVDELFVWTRVHREQCAHLVVFRGVNRPALDRPDALAYPTTVSYNGEAVTPPTPLQTLSTPTLLRARGMVYGMYS